MTVYYTSDHHLLHPNILTYCHRPWPDVQQMGEALIARHNEIVGPQDTVWMLGDFSLSLAALSYVRRFHGRKRLIPGNHDHCWSNRARQRDRARAHRAVQRYLDAGFEEVYPEGVVREHRLGDLVVDLAHLPYAGDHTAEDRFASRRPADQGRWLLCGHVHTAWTILGHQINIGVDMWEYRPVPAEKLEQMIKALS